MKQRLYKIVPKPLRSFVRSLRNRFTSEFARASFSQEGEDMILARIFEGEASGFYVDVGAHHPKRFSNTYIFHLAGWSGINIDAMPGSMKAFNKLRKNDVNIECGVSDMMGDIPYYIFNETALNGFDKELAEQRDSKFPQYRIVKTVLVPVLTLEAILDKNMTPDRQIDFLSIDVEGFDLQVLRSNNWQKYRPKIVLVEILKSNFVDFEDDPIVKFMLDKNYVFVAKTVNTAFFRAEH